MKNKNEITICPPWASVPDPISTGDRILWIVFLATCTLSSHPVLSSNLAIPRGWPLNTEWSTFHILSNRWAAKVRELMNVKLWGRLCKNIDVGVTIRTLTFFTHRYFGEVSVAVHIAIGGGIFRGQRANQSCQILVDLVSKVLCLIYRKKKAKLTVKLWDHYSFLHFIRNGTTSSGNDWSWFGEKIGYNIWKLQRLSFFLTSVATLKLVTLMSLWRVFMHCLFLYQAEISLVRCIHSIDFWQVNNLRVNTYCNPHTCTTAFFSSTKQATRLFIKTRIGIRRFPKWNFLEGVYSLGCLWIVGGLGPSEISAKVTNKKRFS